MQDVSAATNEASLKELSATAGPAGETTGGNGKAHYRNQEETGVVHGELGGAFDLKRVRSWRSLLSAPLTQRVCPCDDSGNDHSVCCTTTVTWAVFESLYRLLRPLIERMMCIAHTIARVFLHCFSAGNFLATL